MEKTINQEKLKQKRDSTLFLNKIYILGYFFFGVDFVLKKKVNLQMKKWIYRIKRITLNFYCFKVTSVRIISLYANGIDTAQKMKFPLRISSVNVTKSAVYGGFGHIYWRSSYGKLNFLCSASVVAMNKLGKVWFHSTFLVEFHGSSIRNFKSLKQFFLNQFCKIALNVWAWIDNYK